MKGNWEIKTLPEISQYFIGLTYAPRDVNSKGLIVLRSSNIQDGKLDLSDLVRVTCHVKESLKVRSGDILMCSRNGSKRLVGKTVMLGELPEEMTFGTFMTIVRGKHNPYLAWFFKSSSFREQLGVGENTMINQITKYMLNVIRVPIPSDREQRRIVAILNDAFAGIAVAKTVAERNLASTQMVFSSHLNALLSQSGAGWTDKSIAELVLEGTLSKPFDGNHGEIHPRKHDFRKSGVPFVMASDLRDGTVDTSNCAFLSRKQADSLRVGFAKDGDVLISHKGTIGRSAILHTSDDYIMLTPQVTAYRVTDLNRLHNRYVRYAFMSPVFQRAMISGAADGSTRAYIGITKQLLLRIRFPNVHDQIEIADKLDSLGTEIHRLDGIYRRKLLALDNLEKALLHRAFSGKLSDSSVQYSSEAIA